METTLFILETPFKDENLSSDDYFCWSCVLMEGILAKFPKELAGLKVQRMGFPRPREAVVALVGEDNQSLPTLILGDGVLTNEDTSQYGNVRFLKGNDKILNALTMIYGIPHVHP